MKSSSIYAVLFTFLFLLLTNCSSETDDTDVEVHNKEEQAIGEFTDDWTFKVFPKSPYNNFQNGEFRLWIPENVTDVKAVLVLLAGSNGNALGLAEAEEWQTYAEQEKLALCSVFLSSTSTSSYTQAIGGSGQALIDAIEKIAKKNSVPEIASLPFLFRGYSAGGVFAYNFSTFEPGRTMAFADIRGVGIDETSIRNIAVPGLILSGELEGVDRAQYLRDIVLNKRNDGGLWSFAIEPNAEHFSELKASDSLIRTFFTGVLKQRISDKNSPLEDINAESGWLGNITGTEAFPYAEYPGNTSRANWLIDETFAKAWLEFQK